jgi:hypothetical protein
VERIDPEAQVGGVRAADDVPRSAELADRAAPRQRLVRDPDPERHGEHRELAQVARDQVAVLGCVRQGRRADQQHARLELGAQREHRARDVELVLVQPAGQRLEVAQDLEPGDPQAAGAHGAARRGGAVGVRHQVARRQHDLGEPAVAHGAQLGLERTGQRDGVHPEVVVVAGQPGHGGPGSGR